MHPLQRVSGDMIESSQAEPIRDGGRAESNSTPARHPCSSPVAIYIHARTDLLRQKRGKRKRRVERGPHSSSVSHFCERLKFSPAAVISCFNPAARICISFSRVSLSINWFQIEDLERLKPIKSSGGKMLKQQWGKHQNVFAFQTGEKGLISVQPRRLTTSKRRRNVFVVEIYMSLIEGM